MTENRTRTQLIIVGAIALAIGGGILGAIIWGGIGGGSSATARAATSGGQTNLLAAMKRRGVLRMGCASSPPTVYQKSNGQWTGPDLLPAKQLAAALHIKFQCVSADWSNIVTGLQAGRYDFAADLDETTERALAIQFTDPIWSYPGVFLAFRNDTAHHTSKAILASGKPITTAAGNAEADALIAIHAHLLQLPNYQDTTFALVGHRAVAAFYDEGTAVTYARKYKQLCVVVPSPAIFVHGVSYGVPADTNAQSLQAVNITINNLVNSGQIQRTFKQAGYLSVSQLGSLRCP